MVSPSLRPAWLAAVVLLSVAMSAAQSVSPTNWTSGNAGMQNFSDIVMTMSAGSGPPGTPYDLLPLTSSADNVIPENGRIGNVFVADSSTYLNATSSDVVFMSCDPLNGYIQPVIVFDSVMNANPVAVVFYSLTADYCSLGGGATSYQFIYSMKSENSTNSMLSDMASLNQGSTRLVTATIVLESDKNSIGNNTGNSTSSSNQQNQNGPSPTTAVAMIVLYSVTGIITGLFLIVIITGAIRAHRHPERYGPRNVLGRPRQSRARGLARAMLDSLPIVKVGEREDLKPTDVELAANQHGQVEVLPEQETARSADAITPAASASADNAASGASKASPTAAAAAVSPIEEGKEEENGIAAATQPDSAPKETNQGCSICTEDFQTGEDQRVLPCDHRFHPVCIDPWLLNVSGTCPLCRIDLRPRASTETASEGAGHDDEMAPPLEAEESGSRRHSIRRSVFLGITGIRPERMSREERVQALRELRGRQLHQMAVRRRESQIAAASAAAAASPGEEETSRRRRLRNAFRIRTRRTGEEDAGEQQTQPEEGGNRVEGQASPEHSQETRSQ